MKTKAVGECDQFRVTVKKGIIIGYYQGKSLRIMEKQIATDRQTDRLTVTFLVPNKRLYTSKGSYRFWKKIVKVWMMMMMKEGIFAGYPSLALPLPPPCLDCLCLTCPCPQPARHPPPTLTLAPLTLAS